MTKIFFMLSVILVFSCPVYGEDTTPYNIMEQYSTKDISIYSGQDIDGIFNRIIKGELTFSYIKDKLSDTFRKEIRSASSIFKNIIFICILNGVLNTALSTQISKTAFVVTYIMAVSLCIGSLEISLELLTNTLDTAVETVNASVPVILGLLVAKGGGSGAALAGTFLYSFTGILNGIIKNFIVSLIGLYIVCNVVNSFSPKDMLTKLSQLLYSICLWAVRIIAFVFGASLTVIKMYITQVDNSSAKILGQGIKAVPVVGDIFSGSVGTVVSAAKAAGGGFGMALIIVLLTASAVPLVKTAVIAVIYKLAAALSQPVSDKAMAEIIDSAGNANMLILILMLTSVFMFCGGVIILLGGFMGG